MTGSPRMVTSAERLRRLLALVPYVASRKSVSLTETAATFGVTQRELIDDLNLAWCVELKDPQPYCPIDLSYEGGEIVVSQAESIERPLRLAADEATALLVALQMLKDVGTGNMAVVDGVTDKLVAAVGGEGASSAQVAAQVHVVSPTDKDGHAESFRRALATGKRVHMSYYVPGRDEATERDVDPMRVLVADGRTYLEGWCRRAEEVRLFRLDRVLRLDVLEDVPAQVPEEAEPRDVDAGLFRPSPQDVLVVLEVSAVARWVAEHYPTESATSLDGGWTRVSLRTPDTRWVRRLALRLGEDARIVSPPALAAEVREAALAALAQYE
jgi:proteasome accessory factor C